jgi:hypothetical protein
VELHHQPDRARVQAGDQQQAARDRAAAQPVLLAGEARMQLRIGRTKIGQPALDVELPVVDPHVTAHQRPHGRPFACCTDTILPPTPTVVHRPTDTLLVGDGRWSPATTGPDLGIVHVATAAYLLHPKHAALGIGAGRYQLRRQRERTPIGTRILAD